MKQTADSMMNAGMKNRLEGRILTSEIISDCSVSPIYTRPLQNPRAKLLYHKSADGRGKRSFVTIEASISAARDIFEIREENRVRKKPDEVSVTDDRNRAER